VLLDTRCLFDFIKETTKRKSKPTGKAGAGGAGMPFLLLDAKTAAATT